MGKFVGQSNCGGNYYISGHVVARCEYTAQSPKMPLVIFALWGTASSDLIVDFLDVTMSKLLYSIPHHPLLYLLLHSYQIAFKTRQDVGIAEFISEGLQLCHV